MHCTRPETLGRDVRISSEQLYQTNKSSYISLEYRELICLMGMQVNALDNEFAGVLSYNAERLDRLQAITTRPGHPAGKFSWGNKQSLWSEPLRAGGLRLSCHAAYSTHCSLLDCSIQQVSICSTPA